MHAAAGKALVNRCRGPDRKWFTAREGPRYVVIGNRHQVHHGVTDSPERAPREPRSLRLAYAALAYVLAWSITGLALWFVRPQVIVEAPAVLLLVIAVSVAVAFACGGLLYVHNRFTSHDFVQHNEVGGFMIAVAGTLYAVLLGFLTVIAWQHFSDARQHVALEAAAATDAWHAAVGIPVANRMRVRQDLYSYATLMLHREWPDMRTGRFEDSCDFIVMDAINAAGTFKPANLMESNSQTATLAQLGALHDGRLQRLSENSTGIAGFEWVILIGGAVCIIAFCWLFGLTNRYVHLIMTSTIAAIIASVLVLLFELQYPYRSDLRILPEPWSAAIDHIRLMQTGSQMNMRM